MAPGVGRCTGRNSSPGATRRAGGLRVVRLDLPPPARAVVAPHCRCAGVLATGGLVLMVQFLFPWMAQFTQFTDSNDWSGKSPMSTTKILVVDNYDSFVYTLVGYLQELGAETTVVRNDDVTLAEAIEMAEARDGVLVSPGPGTPAEAGVCIELIKWCGGHGRPMLEYASGTRPWPKPTAAR